VSLPRESWEKTNFPGHGIIQLHIAGIPCSKVEKRFALEREREPLILGGQGDHGKEEGTSASERYQDWEPGKKSRTAHAR